MLRKYVNEQKENWDMYLDTCTFAYNSSRHESTLYTPFEVMFGRKAVIPVELDIVQPTRVHHSLDKASYSEQQSIESLFSSRKELLQKVKSNILRAQKKQQEHYDKKHAIPPSFRVGISVSRKDFTRRKRHGGKMDPKWVGPYLIVQDLGKGFYKLQSPDNSQDVVL